MKAFILTRYGGDYLEDITAVFISNVHYDWDKLKQVWINNQIGEQPKKTKSKKKEVIKQFEKEQKEWAKNRSKLKYADFLQHLLENGFTQVVVEIEYGDWL